MNSSLFSTYQQVPWPWQLPLLPLWHTSCPSVSLGQWWKAYPLGSGAFGGRRSRVEATPLPSLPPWSPPGPASLPLYQLDIIQDCPDNNRTKTRANGRNTTAIQWKLSVFNGFYKWLAVRNRSRIHNISVHYLTRKAIFKSVCTCHYTPRYFLAGFLWLGLNSRLGCLSGGKWSGGRNHCLFWRGCSLNKSVITANRCNHLKFKDYKME